MTATRLHAEHLITIAPTDDGVPSVHSPGVVDVAGGDVVWSGPAADAPAMTATPVVGSSG